MAVIDNKLITLQTTAGYSVEPVVCLWYANKNEKKGDFYGKQTQTAGRWNDTQTL